LVGKGFDYQATKKVWDLEIVIWNLKRLGNIKEAPFLILTDWEIVDES